ncbi:MAG: ribonuclease P protein component [Alicyclobacillus sp.]|nr:ribonuclease P protein component [Alicyclobacillus sp.]
MVAAVHRLKENRDFRRVFQRGKSAATSRLVLYWARNREASFRVGFSVSKKVGGAVQRNLLKRRLRGCFDELAEVLESHRVDFVVIGRKGAAEASYRDLREDLQKLLKRAQFMV